MKLKTFYKAMISAGVFLLFCTFPGADVKAGDTAENIYCNISYEYVIKSADGTTALADGDEKARLDNQNSANPTSYDPEYEATKEELKLQAFDTERYYDFKGWYETQEKAEEGKETDQVWSIPSDLSEENKNKDITLYARLEETVYNIAYILDPGDSENPGPDPNEMGSNWNDERNPSTYTAKDVDAKKLVYSAKNQFRTVSGVRYLAASFSGWHTEGEELAIGGYWLKLPDNGKTLILYAQYVCKWIFYDPDVALIQQTVKEGKVALNGMIYPGAQVYASKYTLPDDTKEKICSGLSKDGELLGAYQVRLLCPANPLNPKDKDPESRWDVPHVGDLDLTLQVAIPGAAAFESDGFKLCRIEADQSFTCIPLKKSKDQGIGSEGTWYEAKVTALTEREADRAFAVTGIRREETKPVPDDHKSPDNPKGQGAKSDPAKNVNKSNTVKKTKVVTGDDSNAGALLAVMACALAAAGVSVVMRKGRKRNQH